MSPTDSLMAPTLVRRLACMLYESTLVFGIAVGAGLLFSIPAGMRSGMDERRPLFLAFIVVVLGIYFVWCWVRGQTLAMKTWGIRVVDRHGRPLGQLRALFRYACCWLWVLPPLAVVAPMKMSAGGMFGALLGWIALLALASNFHPQRQFWHDELAGTRLIPAPTAGK
ncbi:RDD family protein [Caenimonas terrae]|uniref:RDD family protein n=1 Tax=Caenimonas terrae TaxID=696074 RepID=A0ABW0NBQ9_9BURK